MCIFIPLVQAVHFDWPAGQTHTMKDQFFMVLQCKKDTEKELLCYEQEVKRKSKTKQNQEALQQMVPPVSI